jgi:V8-like Glu-specific endopeptidase
MMLKSVQLAVISCALFSYGVHARAIYGQDNRIEIFEGTPMQQKLAKSTATMVDDENIIREGNLITLRQETLKEEFESPVTSEAGASSPARAKFFEVPPSKRMGKRLCEAVRFSDQPTPGTCSGFLIAQDLLVTAGHCSKVPNFCFGTSWVFDFQVNPTTKKAGLDIKESNIYKCKSVISSAQTEALGLDYALIQLDRPVVGREPLEIRSSTEIAVNTNLFVIGSPVGLPLKIAGGAKVRETSHPFHFSANLDTFNGNSGSAIFNASTGVVEGILVLGETDYVLNKKKSCFQEMKCEDGECRGETVTRMTAIPEIGVQSSLNEAAFSGDAVTVKNILKLSVWVDFYTKDGETALMKAAQGGKKSTIKALLDNGAKASLKDALGNTALHHLAKVLKVSNQDALAALYAGGVSRETKNKAGDTALLVAAKNLNLEGVKLLLKDGFNKNAVDKNGESLLFSMTRSGNMDAVFELIKLGVNASLKNSAGQTIVDLKDMKGKFLISKWRLLMAKGLATLPK